MNPGFRCRHWPGFRGRTHVFTLAAPYVFIKQSGPPCHCDLQSRSETKTAGTPYPEVTGLICRVPSLGVYPTRLRLLAKGHLCRFLVRSQRILPDVLFTGSRNRLNHPKTDSYSRFRLVLAITALPKCMRLNRATTLLNLSRNVRHRALRRRVRTSAAPES